MTIYKKIVKKPVKKKKPHIKDVATKIELNICIKEL